MIDGLMMLDGLPGATIPDMDCPVPLHKSVFAWLLAGCFDMDMDMTIA